MINSNEMTFLSKKGSSLQDSSASVKDAEAIPGSTQHEQLVHTATLNVNPDAYY